MSVVYHQHRNNRQRQPSRYSGRAIDPDLRWRSPHGSLREGGARPRAARATALAPVCAAQRRPDIVEQQLVPRSPRCKSAGRPADMRTSIDAYACGAMNGISGSGSGATRRSTKTAATARSNHTPTITRVAHHCRIETNARSPRSPGKIERREVLQHDPVVQNVVETAPIMVSGKARRATGHPTAFRRPA